MGIIYTVSLATADARAWLLEQGIECSDRASRWPTGNELKYAVECFRGIQVQYNDNGVGYCWQALLSNGEAGTEEVWAALNVEKHQGYDQTNDFWFDKGTTELNVAIALVLSAKTGPLVLLADCGGPPLVVDYPNTTQQTLDEWVDVSKPLWIQLYRDVQRSCGFAA